MLSVFDGPDADFLRWVLKQEGKARPLRSRDHVVHAERKTLGSFSFPAVGERSQGEEGLHEG